LGSRRAGTPRLTGHGSRLNTRGRAGRAGATPRSLNATATGSESANCLAAVQRPLELSMLGYGFVEKPGFVVRVRGWHWVPVKGSSGRQS